MSKLSQWSSRRRHRGCDVKGGVFVYRGICETEWVSKFGAVATESVWARATDSAHSPDASNPANNERIGRRCAASPRRATTRSRCAKNRSRRATTRSRRAKTHYRTEARHQRNPSLR